MHPTRWLLTACAGWLVAAPGALALNLGQPPSRVAMGSTLNMTWPLRLDPGEVLEPECVSAEVLVGNRPIPLHNLRWWIEPGPARNERVVRVVSLVVITEPVVTVQLSAGCTAQVSRRFTTFADPPLSVVPQADAAHPAIEPPATAALPPLSAASQEATAPAGLSRAQVPRARASAPQSRLPVKPRRSTAQSLEPGANDAQPGAAPPAARLSLSEAPGLEVLHRELASTLAEYRAGAAQEAAQSAESASAAASSARAAAERVQALEERVTRLLAENQQQREQMQLLRQRASHGESASRWMPWLLTALLLCLGTVAWLTLKLRRQQREAQSKWWADAADVLADARRDPPPSQPTPAPLAGDPHVPDPVPAKPQAWPPAAPSAPADENAASSPKLRPGASSIASADTLLNPVSVEPDRPTTSPLPRPLSIEELIDLEQQAEFFVVLGQDDSAIDLLMSHLRDTGGTSPLPYLKLLEIYRRRGEQEAYERIRGRFNLRFNAYAPAWRTDMRQGRTLEDYPQVMLRLQRAWASPIDAMAELQTLMFRNEGGELFELPAYSEVLMLYSLARELLDDRSRSHGDVDVLLPLTIDNSERVITLPAEESSAAAPLRVVDLDLGDSAAGPSDARHRKH